MQLSIVIPTYNEAKYLPTLLQSIRNQHFRDYEIIIADHHSIDDTRAIAQKWGATIVSGGLPGKGRNCGAAAAQGDLILFLDADVVLPSVYFLDTILLELKDRKYDIATCQIHPLSDRKIDLALHQSYNLFLMLTANFLPHAPGFCILVDRNVHRAIKGFDEKILLGEDSDYVQRARKVAKFGILTSQKINVSVRRLDRDGRWNIAAKYILCGLYMSLIGKVDRDIFRYSFGYDSTTKGNDHASN